MCISLSGLITVYAELGEGTATLADIAKVNAPNNTKLLSLWNEQGVNTDDPSNPNFATPVDLIKDAQKYYNSPTLKQMEQHFELINDAVNNQERLGVEGILLRSILT